MSIRRRSEFAILVLLALPAAGARAASPTPSGAVGQDPLVRYREQFKLGMDRYRAGAIAEAVEYWEPIYRDLGRSDGYRLAYNLGLAYAELGDATHAAQRLRSFLDEVDARRTRGERFESLVIKEEADARSRIASLVATQERLVGDAGAPSAPVETLEAGPTPGPVASPLAPAPPVEVASALAPPPPPAVVPDDVSHASPFSPALFYASGGLAVAAGVAAVALEANANSLRNRFVAERDATGTIPQQDRDTFDTARSWSYAALGGAVGCAAITAGLVTWYVLGTSRHETPVVVTAGAARAGGSLGVLATF
jgi:hypothetical protein